MSNKQFGRGWKRRSRHARRSNATNPLRLVAGREADIRQRDAYQRFVDAQSKVYHYSGTEDVSHDLTLAEGAQNG